MKASEIIVADFARRGVHDPRVLKGLEKQVTSGTTEIFQSGKTVITVKKIAPEVGAIHLYSVDSPMGMIQALAHFVQHGRLTRKYHTVYGKVANAAMIRILRHVGLPVTHSDRPEYNWMARI